MLKQGVLGTEDQFKSFHPPPMLMWTDEAQHTLIIQPVQVNIFTGWYVGTSCSSYFQIKFRHCIKVINVILFQCNFLISIGKYRNIHYNYAVLEILGQDTLKLIGYGK